MYSPTLGRFLQRDPVGYLDAMNLYQYVGNNPVNWVDPMGLCEELSQGNGVDYLAEPWWISLIPFKKWEGQDELEIEYGEWKYSDTLVPPALSTRIGGDYPAIFYRDVNYQQNGYYTVSGRPIPINIRRRWKVREPGHGDVRITKWSDGYTISVKGRVQPGLYRF